ncbi:MAG: futalosine hydrolase [Bacteroidales bacterium]|nr:futalosine hydrolase [Bacteroidales bacterium]HOK99539.1 futalosine hydrolase [Bacteroidales bacterium]HPO66397.1 futalosine hydrolase [Bacteroidales bacterium]
MNILIIASSEKEVKFVLEQEVAVYLPAEHVYTFNRGGNTFDFLITGAGMVQATYWTTRLITTKKYDLAIHVGLAGSYRDQIRVGSVVNVTSELFADIGYTQKGDFISIFQAGVQDKNAFPFQDGKLYYDFDASGFRLLKTLQRANAITVSHNTGEPADMVEKIEKFDPDIESLDGAAVLFVCQMHRVPCMALRSVSYAVESFHTRNWLLPEALFSLGKHLYFLLTEFK